MSAHAVSEQEPAGARPGFDLGAYLDRIGYRGPLAPSLETLKALHALHPQAVAFENLDPFLARPVRLDAASLQAKLVDGRRGGYCFEQNLMFMDALRALGFSAGGLAARVLWNRPRSTVGARSHMLIRVEIDGGSWLADVGFGGQTQTGPLLLEPGLVQETPHERYRVVEEDGHFVTETEVAGEWRPLYRFDLAENFEADYEVSSYFLSTEPHSPFVIGLMLARPLPDRRHALANNRLSTHHLSGRSERRELESPAELARTVEELFGIELPDRPAFERTAREKGLFG